MCNVYTMNATNTMTGCGTNYGCFNGYGQRMCRDGCGNVWMRMTTNQCGCYSCCRCSNGCNTGNTQTDTGAVNGNYGCVTLCGATAYGTTQTTNANSTTYPARRCGGDVCGYNRCGGWNYGCY